MIVITHEHEVAERAARVIRLRDGAVIEDVRQADRLPSSGWSAAVNFSSVTIALRGIIANKMRSALTTLGIMIGVASVIVLVGVGSGSAAASRKQLEGSGFEHPDRHRRRFRLRARRRHAKPQGDDHRRRRQGPRRTNRTRRTSRRSYPPSNATNATAVLDGASTTPQQVQGTTPNFSSVRNYPVQYGRFFTQADYDAHANVVVVGSTVVKNLLGEQADLSSVVGKSIKIGGKTFSIIGVFKTKGSNGIQDQDNLAIMPLTTMRDTLSGNSGTVDGLTIQAAERRAPRPPRNRKSRRYCWRNTRARARATTSSSTKRRCCRLKRRTIAPSPCCSEPSQASRFSSEASA